VDSFLEAVAAAELIDELGDAAHCGEGRDAKYLRIAEVEHALVLIFRQQRIEHSAGLRSIFGEGVALSDIVGPLASCERRAVEGDVTDEIERVEVLAQLLGDGIKRQPSLASSSIIACFRSVPFQRLRKSSRLAKRRFSAALVKSRKDFGDQLTVLVEIFDTLRDNESADAIHIDFAPALAARRYGDVRGLAIDNDLAIAGGGWDRLLAVAGRRHVVGRCVIGSSAPGS